LVLVRDYGEYEILGRTQDDAAGEAFDKVAREIGLGYPGGPKIDKASKEGDPHAIVFPRGKVAGSRYDFSFSGMKSAVLNYLNTNRMKGITVNVPDVAASFQQAVVDVLVTHAADAVDQYGLKKFALAGGVASNTALRAGMRQMCADKGVDFYCPSPILCTDNAAMIGSAAYYEYRKGQFSGLDLNAVPGLRLGQR
ncbi:MAG: tRNA (adenosine(37)-N6)-threonylcarbamoyltransferase complex transferase subunit TsaD, partial [Lachnospiraceae bacterium]|nr:tRNA (adenosine(37)-N6)-threonylcarbamoyltransferase complex transferase subunit TsaD [Lachnospiraceae bacterium]